MLQEYSCHFLLVFQIISEKKGSKDTLYWKPMNESSPT